MIFAVLPVKAPQNAKQRLAEVLPADARERLARILFEHAFAALSAARGIDRIVVVTSDLETANHAYRMGAWILEEREQHSHNKSADHAAFWAKEQGADTVALVPIDVPLVRPADFEVLVAGALRPGVGIVPSADGAGTNALVRSPPDVIESRFGTNSFEAHLSQARERGVSVSVLRPPGLVFDLDGPEDVPQLLARAPHCRAAQFLRSQCTFRS